MSKLNPHNLPEEISLSEILESDIGTIYFYPNLVVVEAKEGVTLSYTTGFSLLVSGLRRLGSRPFVYIANRINSYSVNPNDYIYLEKVPSLKGIAIVTPNEIGKKNAEMELNFFNKPMAIFDSISEAYTWGTQILNH